MGWMSSLRETSPTMPCGAGCSRATLLDAARGVRATKATRAPRAEQLADEGQAEPGGAAGDGDSEPGHGSAGRESCSVVVIAPSWGPESIPYG